LINSIHVSVFLDLRHALWDQTEPQDAELTLPAMELVPQREHSEGIDRHRYRKQRGQDRARA
jgi:hypothetical protein